MNEELTALLDEHHKIKTRLDFVNEHKEMAEKEVLRHRSEAARLERQAEEVAKEIVAVMKEKSPVLEHGA
ncbi:hypothetical protein [Brevibacillus porteri]|uniref:Uncharacterized protein n=1 Tax=Brevibacillus porteri TaxID=2126350 RepID=A0ABX5FS85_9BACL|nr:hypothetical protein [Brevibacillus porteri]MED1801826.1 hypothetical protein [Brevibacillus porteri]MED2134957.1 hypothetical protein [Brevibacillus porteri]MED2745479.1 hypothetical protein [Brevibacillus porteri]MED2815775.1 hypothetical protein [Brevibacillus porteri]MED2897613.1 hypothetical protein [Brevibacillus porteri]